MCNSPSYDLMELEGQFGVIEQKKAENLTNVPISWMSWLISIVWCRTRPFWRPLVLSKRAKVHLRISFTSPKTSQLLVSKLATPGQNSGFDLGFVFILAWIIERTQQCLDLDSVSFSFQRSKFWLKKLLHRERKKMRHVEPKLCFAPQVLGLPNVFCCEAWSLCKFQSPNDSGYPFIPDQPSTRTWCCIRKWRFCFGKNLWFILCCVAHNIDVWLTNDDVTSSLVWIVVGHDRRKYGEKMIRKKREW